MVSLGVKLVLAAVAAAAPVAGNAAELPQDQRDRIVAAVADYQPKLSTVALDIWRYSELGFQEEKSSRRLADELKKAGFSVRWGVASMPTAFIASYRRGQGR